MAHGRKDSSVDRWALLEPFPVTAAIVRLLPVSGLGDHVRRFAHAVATEVEIPRSHGPSESEELAHALDQIALQIRDEGDPEGQYAVAFTRARAA